jgi:hypothetical protein
MMGIQREHWRGELFLPGGAHKEIGRHSEFIKNLL